MTLDQLRKFHQIGQLTNARIVPNPGGDGFLLEIELLLGRTIYMLKTRPEPDMSHAIRIFSSIDGAWALATAIGFKAATIVAREETNEDEDFTLK